MKDINLKQMTGQQLSQAIYLLRMRAGKDISYEQAKQEAEPYLKELNLRTSEIAKEFNRKPRKFQFAGFGRPVGMR